MKYAISTHHRNRTTCIGTQCLKERQRRERNGQGSGDLSQAAAAELARHEAGDDDGRGLREDGEEPQPNQRKTEERQADALDEGRERRIGDKSPVEMARIAQELEFVAVKAVAAVGEHVKQRDGGGNAKQNRPIRGLIGGFRSERSNRCA